MAARWTAWIVWAALAGSVVAWALHLRGRPAPVPAHAETVSLQQAVQGDVRRLFAVAAPASAAAVEAAPEAAGRFQVLGVAAGARGSVAGWALIAVDGQAARAVAVGEPVGPDGWILQSVTTSQVSLGPRGAAPALQLALPLLPPPQTGSLPAAGATAAAPAAVAPLQGPPGGAAMRPGSWPQRPAPGEAVRLGVPADANGMPQAPGGDGSPPVER
ncbi:MAG: hypothetical protein L6Q75_11265 [Burkholderiaceae bacterium]|nr:hypothetical protein [Burkholderiaceae bacterium]